MFDKNSFLITETTIPIDNQLFCIKHHIWLSFSYDGTYLHVKEELYLILWIDRKDMEEYYKSKLAYLQRIQKTRLDITKCKISSMDIKLEYRYKVNRNNVDITKKKIVRQIENALTSLE